MKIVLIALLFGICQAKPQSLEFFEKTQETFGDEFQEKAMDYITGIDEAFHGKQTGKKYMPLKYRTRSFWHFQFLKKYLYTSCFCDVSCITWSPILE